MADKTTDGTGALEKALDVLDAVGRAPAGLLAPRRFAGELFGHAGELVPAYAGLGLPRSAVGFADREDFHLSAQGV